MRLSSLGASLLIHTVVITALVMPPVGSAPRMGRAPATPVPLKLALIELAKLATPKPSPAPGTIPYPKKKVVVQKTPEPSASPTAKPSAPPKVAAKPTPRPSPTPKPPDPKDKAIFDALRKYPEYAKLTDEQIRAMPKPPGMKDWASVLAMTANLDKLDWTSLPPDTGAHAATASVGGFFGWAPPAVGQDSNFMGASAQRTMVNGKWQFAFQYFSTIMVAEWSDGAGAAQVAYYPYGGKPDPARTFQVAVKPADTELSAEMIAQFTLISMGQPPAPVPTAVSSIPR